MHVSSSLDNPKAPVMRNRTLCIQSRWEGGKQLRSPVDVRRTIVGGSIARCIYCGGIVRQVPKVHRRADCYSLIYARLPREKRGDF